MNILSSIDGLVPVPGPIVLAAGTFDGLHLGHQALIRRAMEEAEKLGGTAVVMTFDRHPCVVVRPEKCPHLLTTLTSKIELLDSLRVPALLLLEFTPRMASLPPEEFIGSIAVSANLLRMICVGSQWSFGRGGEGNIPMLEKLGGRHGFSVCEISPVEIDGEPVSSTRIRKKIASGDFNGAAACLGRPFLLSGRVVTGAGLGSKIGFPTANLNVPGMQLPPDGVYAVRMHFSGRICPGVANIGMRPTVAADSRNRTVEVHLFDFTGNLLGKEPGIEFVQYLRAEQKFPDLPSLVSQITKDCQYAQLLLKELPMVSQ